MGRNTTIGLVVAALLAGLIIGNVVSVSAAPRQGPGPGDGLRMGAAMRDAGGRLADVVAKLTGIPVADVEAARRNGTSFADIAASKGVDASAVVKAALDARKAMLAERVKAGAITQERADAALDRMKTRLTECVQSVDAPCCGGGRGARAGRGRGPGACGGRGMGGERKTGPCDGLCAQAAPTN